ncbi:MAG: glycoside hydrolase family 28 protein [Chlorobi bacterium]|nr:glycoside hydrolase family 28 protein [Chlorobiota bacterium]
MKNQRISLFGLFICLIFTVSCTNKINDCEDNKYYDFANNILDSIKAPVFPNSDFYVTDYGAISGGKDCTTGFKRAIEACNKSGGGRVIVPKGIYYSGTIHLLSNVNLHLEDSAVIRFSTNPDDYLPLVKTRFEGCELYNYSPLIYAYKQINIAITGNGLLDGQASKENWWMWKLCTIEELDEGYHSQEEPESRPLLLSMMNSGVPVEKRIFGKGHFLRSSFIQPYECKNILIEGVTVIRPPMWMIHPVLSENVIVRNVKLLSFGAPNGDGCNPECCRNVLVEGAVFNTGDDCIAIKSGRNRDGYVSGIPSENIIVRNCKMQSGHGGIAIGSELSGGVRNVFVYDCKMSSPDLQRALRIKSNKYRGGFVNDVFLWNIKVGQVSNAAIRINQKYFENSPGLQVKYTEIKDIYIKDFVCKKAEYAVQILGVKEKPVRHVIIVDSEFDSVRKENVLEGVEDVEFKNVMINGQKIKTLKDENSK